MTDVRAQCAAVLRDLVSQEGTHGACIVSRDGLPALAEWPHPADLETLAAMGAALMGAAETSLLEFGDRDLETVLVVSQEMRLVILGVDDELLLLVAMARNIPIEQFDEQLLNALSGLRKALAD